MKKIFLLIIILCLVESGYCQQSTFGWYHLLSGAKTRVLTNYVDPGRDVRYATDEILLLFDFRGNVGYAVDIDGRIIEVEDITKIQKITMEGRVVKMTKDIDVSLNKTLGTNNNVWLIGFNSAANTAKVLLSNGNIVEIPKDSYVDIRDYYLEKGAGSIFNDVVNK